ncbi:ATP-binding protein [uncultured Oxalobacter sp.]|uniref:ATP-binding protein n=1 Tax=uncultured Oxalobacter sp. TaxID=337245 RepID=UPI002596D283|nr:ATP-binding protein [uncultured Oxalobacter sp.]
MKTVTENQLFGNPDWVQEVLNTSNTGLWSICVDTGTGVGRMYASDMMLQLLGLDDHPAAEECYSHWFSRIDAKAMDYVETSVAKMLETGQFSEVQYLWHHPKWGDIYIRCGGKVYRREGNEIELRGYHQNISELEQLKEENLQKKQQLIEVEKEKNRYNSLFESVMCGIVQYRLAENDNVVFKNANHEAIRILGYEREEFWSRKEWHFPSLVASYDREQVFKEVSGLQNVGDKSHFEYRLLRKDGTPCWIIGCVEMILDVDGETVFQSVFLDIDDSKKAEIENAMLAEKVQASNELLRIALEHTKASEIYYYPGKRLVIVPERTQVRYRCKARYENMPHSLIDDFVDPISRDACMEMYRRIHEGEKTASCEMKTQDSADWNRTTLSTVTVKDGKPVFVVGIVEDITNEKNIELENVQLHAIHDYIMNNDYDLMSIGDLNKSQYSMRFSDDVDKRGMPLSGNLFEGHSEFIEKFVHPDERRRISEECDLHRLMKNLDGVGGSYSFYYRSTDDQPRFKEGKISYFNGFRDRLLLTVRDVHEMRLKEERIRQTLTDALMVAEKANTAKSDFLSKMSHDMRTPMNGIIGLAIIAEKYRHDPDRMKEYFSKITVASHHLLGLINDVLDMSKIDSGKIVLVSERFNLVSLLKDVVDIVMPDLKSRQHAVRMSVASDVHERVEGDQLRLQQVFMNILSNAVKFTPAGGHIGIDVSESPSTFAGYGCYRLVFSDDGIGMSKEYLKKIFVPFEREDNSMTSKISGTGLGMPISKAIVEMMNGSFDVESERGVGSTFTITVHLKHQPVDSGMDTGFLRGQPVLVVDDDAERGRITVAMLNGLGVVTKQIGSAREALGRIVDADESDHPYYAVLMNGGIVDMEASEFARRVRLREKHAVRLVLCSDNPDGIARVPEVDAVIAWPLGTEKLVSILTTLNREPENASDASMRTDFTGKRILLVEDNELNLEIAAEILKMTEAMVDTAEDGAEAVAKVEKSPEGYYDMVLMDIQMPVMDGYVATHHIRELPRNDVLTLPIVAMTANAFPEDVKKAIDAGMNEHIAKPIDLSVLYQVLNRWLK